MSNLKFLYQKLYVIIIIIGGLSLGQNRESFAKSIDSTTHAANDLYNNENFSEAYQAYQKVIKQSKETDYSAGITEGSLGAALCLYVMGELDESTRLLLLAKKEKYVQGYPEVLMEINFQLALNLHALQLTDEAIKYYTLSSKYAEKLTDIDRKNYYLSANYGNIGSLYHAKQIFDSAKYYYYKSYNIPTIAPEEKLASNLSLADVYIDQNQLDSAQKYITLGNSYARKLTSSPTFSALNYRILGKYKQAQGDYKEAIGMFKETLRLNSEVGYTDASIFQLLAESYKKLGETDSVNFYLQKYMEVKSNVKEIDNKKVASLIFLDEKQSLKNNYLITILIIVSAALFIILIAAFFVSKQKRKIAKKSHETKELKKQLNDAFEEVIELAKSNSPNFLARFIEVYPEFYSKLLKINPNLTNSDLIMCAYLKLNFSTKEISDYNFVSIRTVQNRRYRLRKKFNLDEETDMILWINNIDLSK